MELIYRHGYSVNNKYTLLDAIDYFMADVQDFIVGYIINMVIFDLVKSAGIILFIIWINFYFIFFIWLQTNEEVFNACLAILNPEQIKTLQSLLMANNWITHFATNRLLSILTNFFLNPYSNPYACNIIIIICYFFFVLL